MFTVDGYKNLYIQREHLLVSPNSVIELWIQKEPGEILSQLCDPEQVNFSDMQSSYL